MKIAIAGFWHETNTFAIEKNDALDHVIGQENEALMNPHPQSFIGGFLEVVKLSDLDIVPTWGFRFKHGGTISAQMFEHCRDAIVGRIQNAMPLDSVFLALHGAMVAEEPYIDAEGDLVRAVRDVVGDIPIVATYDFHAITSEWEAQNAVGFPNNSNPHIDGYERGKEAAENLIQMMRGEIHPVTHRIFVPIIGPNIGQSTWSHIPDQEEQLLLYQLNLKREALEREPGVINITILGGYGYGDSPDAGMSIIATTDNDAEQAERLAKILAGELWQRREALLKVRPIADIDEGIKQAMQHVDKPVMLVDLGDDPGSACPADSPAVLERLIALGARDCALTIRDAEVVEAGMKADVGATLTLEVGAKADQRFYKPVSVTGTVKLIDDGQYAICGPTHGGWGRDVSGGAFRYANVGPRVVLRIGDRIDVIFSQNRTGKDRDFFKSAGIILEEKQILVVKSNQAHRASFDSVVAHTIELNTPGVSTVRYQDLPYKHLRRPIWPIDPDMTWQV